MMIQNKTVVVDVDAPAQHAKIESYMTSERPAWFSSKTEKMTEGNGSEMLSYFIDEIWSYMRINFYSNFVAAQLTCT